MAASGSPLKVSEAAGGSGKLHVPKDIKAVLDAHLPNVRFTVEITTDGLLYRPVKEIVTELPEDLPSWLQKDAVLPEA